VTSTSGLTSSDVEGITDAIEEAVLALLLFALVE